MESIYVKNMVCPRCITAVEHIFKNLSISVRVVNLGEVQIEGGITSSNRILLKEALEKAGFELLEDQKSKLITQIKTLIIEQIHYQNEPLAVNFSTLLSESLHQEYTSLSRLFSSIEGITIERFILRQKIERVKELIFYKEMTFSEVAVLLGYSSVAHLSAQFKKETGMTPSAFKKLNKPGHSALDGV